MSVINQTSELTWPLAATLTTIAVVGLDYRSDISWSCRSAALASQVAALASRSHVVAAWGRRREMRRAYQLPMQR